MATEDVEDVVRALTAAVENLEAGGARQSMQEAFLQVRAYACGADIRRGEVVAPPMDASRYHELQPRPRGDLP
jgi:hypothetical protein